MEPITVHFKLSEEEYLDAARVLAFRPAGMKIRVAVSFILFAVGLALILSAFDFSLELGLVFGAALLAGFFGLWRFNLTVMPRRFYRGDRKFRDAVTLTFTDEGIAATAKDIESKVRWELYTEAIESSQCYVLVYGKDVRMMTAVPKRAFTDEAQERAFRGMLSSHLGGNLGGLGSGNAAPEREYEAARLEPPDWR